MCGRRLGRDPFRGFVREATEKNLDTRITILYTVRTTSDIIFAEEFRALEARNPRFKFVVTCTRLTPEDPWTGRRGRITPEWMKSCGRCRQHRLLRVRHQ